MINADQPNCFEEDRVFAAVSSKEDGQMQFGWSEANQEVEANRRTFLQKNDLSLERSVLVRVRYHDAATYDVIRTVNDADASEGMLRLEGEAADCLVTKNPNLALFLPVADCIATIVHDPIKNVLALAHLGRHSTVADLAEKLINYFQTGYNSDPKDLIVWMSPSIKSPNYIMQTADFAHKNPAWGPFFTPVTGGFSLDIQGYNRSRFIAAGVRADNITISSINTAKDSNYWSHYTETTVKNKPAPPRFAVVCALQ